MQPSMQAMSSSMASELPWSSNSFTSATKEQRGCGWSDQMRRRSCSQCRSSQEALCLERMQAGAHPPTCVEEVTLGDVDALGTQLVDQLQDARRNHRLHRRTGK